MRQDTARQCQRRGERHLAALATLSADYADFRSYYLQKISCVHLRNLRIKKLSTNPNQPKEPI
jgi:hypothetical protein